MNEELQYGVRPDDRLIDLTQTAHKGAATIIRNRRVHDHKTRWVDLSAADRDTTVLGAVRPMSRLLLGCLGLADPSLRLDLAFEATRALYGF